MDDAIKQVVNTIVATTSGLPAPETLASWTPALSGDIDIVIRSDGSWTHDGTLIGREGLVRVFASLLRRESDGEYYLLTPVEKWRIRVESHALLAIDFERIESNAADSRDSRIWQALLNTGGRCTVDQSCSVVGAVDDAAPYMNLPNGLTAQVTRAAWYRLLDAATVAGDRAYITSRGVAFDLGPTV